MKAIHADTSACLPLFRADVFTPQARRLRAAGEWIISDLAVLEFTSRLSLGTRRGGLSPAEAQDLCAAFDVWRRTLPEARLEPDDVRWAAAAVRRFDTALQTVDALHLAAALRLGATLLTFDGQLAAAARVHRVDVLA